MVRMQSILALLASVLLAGAAAQAGAQQDAAGSAQQTEDGGAPMMQQRTPDSPTQQPGDVDNAAPDSQRQRHEDDRAPMHAPREPEMTAPGVETERGGSVGERPQRQRGQEAPQTVNEAEREAERNDDQESGAWWRFWEGEE